MAIIYLLISGLGLSELVPKILNGILTKISATVILTAIPLGIYDITGIEIFGRFAIAIFAVGLFIAVREPLYDRVKRVYRKRKGSSPSGDEWVCKRCGEINKKIIKECIGCGTISSDKTKEPQAHEAWECKKCGRKNYLTDKNCITCGYPKDDRYT